MVLVSFDEVGMQETSAANQLVLGLVFAQCDEKTLTAVRDTLSSDKCKQMRAGLARMDNLKFPEDCKIPQNVRVGILFPEGQKTRGSFIFSGSIR